MSKVLRYLRCDRIATKRCEIDCFIRVFSYLMLHTSVDYIFSTYYLCVVC